MGSACPTELQGTDGYRHMRCRVSGATEEILATVCDLGREGRVLGKDSW